MVRLFSKLGGSLDAADIQTFKQLFGGKFKNLKIFRFYYDIFSRQKYFTMVDTNLQLKQLKMLKIYLKLVQEKLVKIYQI